MRNSATAVRGLYNCDGSTSIYNNIVWDNTATAHIVKSNLPSRCCIQNWDGGGFGNIGADPRFGDAVGPANPTWTDFDFRLLLDSLCIDTGQTLGDVTLDIDGTPRPLRGKFLDRASSFAPLCDIGAYEFDWIWRGGIRFEHTGDAWNTEDLRYDYQRVHSESYGSPYAVAANEAKYTPASYYLNRMTLPYSPQKVEIVKVVLWAREIGLTLHPRFGKTSLNRGFADSRRRSRAGDDPPTTQAQPAALFTTASAELQQDRIAFAFRRRPPRTTPLP